MAFNLEGTAYIKPNPLLDLDFLDKLHHARVRKTYARVIALDKEERALETIEGVVTSGSISVDGSSAVRRTCSLSMVVKELNIHEYYWGLKTKVELYAGLENNIDDTYPKIIWFKQGTFVLSSFNTQQGLANYTVSLQGKDKMVLLNGELGGVVTSLTWDFGTVKTTHTNAKVKEKDEEGHSSVASINDAVTTENLLLKDIITAAVHTFAVMPFYKIYVNDLDDMGLELLEYRGKNPMYLIQQVYTTRKNLTQNGNAVLYRGMNKQNPIAISDDSIVYDPLFELEQAGITYHPTHLYDEENNVCTVAKIEYGMTAGYRLTDLTYAGDLILNVGDSITQLLDKIVDMLGEYEYFFDLDGNFIFQRKQVYLQTTWTGIKTNDQQEKWVEPNAFSSAITYSFTDAELIHNYSNQPKLDNVRNDFAIWGTRKGVTGKEIPVHLRYAIDDKPIEYVSYDNIRYTTLSLTEAEQRADLEERVKLTDDELEALAIEHLLENHQTAFYSLYSLMNNRTNYGGLPTDKWWDLNDWAQLWMAAVGYVPPNNMGTYSKSRTTEGQYDFSLYFPDASRLSLTTDPHKCRAGVALIHANSAGVIVDTAHSYSCSHPYLHWYEQCNGITPSHYRQQIANIGDMVFIYDPVLPEEVQIVIDNVQQQALEEEKEKVKTGFLKCNLDWREIIYQMSQDYKKHHTEDDFYIQIQKRNPFTCINGITGYEQYYTDMDAFWRELYNPFYDGSYEVLGMTKLRYQRAVDAWYAAPSQDFPYYYGDTNYIQCTTAEPFHSTMQYYVQRIGEKDGIVSYEAVRPGKLQYEENPMLYYYVDPDGGHDIKNCIVEEVWGASNLWYKSHTENNSAISGFGKTQTNNLVNLLKNDELLDAAAFTTLQMAYRNTGTFNFDWWKITSYETQKCFKSNSFVSSYSYWYHDEQRNKDVPILGRDISSYDYYANPGKYWRYEYGYTQCQEGDIFDPNQIYYVQGTEHTKETPLYKQISVTEEMYLVDPTRYYIISAGKRYVNCTSKMEYDNTATYYIQDGYADGSDRTIYNPSKQISEERFLKDPTRYWIADGTKKKITCYQIKVPDDYNKILFYDTSLDLDNINLTDINNRFRNMNNNRFYGNHTKEEIETWLQAQVEDGKEPYAVYATFMPVVHPKIYDPSLTYYGALSDEYKQDGWAPYVSEAPETLNFWFDFLTQDGELQKYSNKAIGNRAKAVNDNNVKAIYFRETPTLIFIDKDSPELNGSKLGYTYINLPNEDLSKSFSLSKQGKSAKTVLDSMLYKYACCADQISFGTIPYYNLEPNKRIFVACPQSGITGEYIMTRFSVPLGPESNMSITGVRAVDALY